MQSVNKQMKAMKRLVLLCSVLITLSVKSTAQNDDTFTVLADSTYSVATKAMADSAYTSGDYTTAIALYEQILQTGESSVLYYNLGNAYYRQDEFGQAILNYERALRLKPNFRDAQENLDLANSKIEDEIKALPELFIVTWARNITTWFSHTGWRIVILCLLALLGAAVAIFVLSRDYLWRKGALIGGIAVTGLLLIAIACSIATGVRQNSHNKAIVTSPLVVVKSSPESNSVDKLILHEGTKVDVEETLGDWHKIHIADGNTGWLTDADITVI